MVRSPIDLSFFFFRTVTLANLIEFRYKVEGEVGVVAENMDSDFWREGSKKDGDEARLRGEVTTAGGVFKFVRGGKSTRDINDGNVWDREGEECVGGKGA